MLDRDKQVCFEHVELNLNKWIILPFTSSEHIKKIINYYVHISINEKYIVFLLNS